MDYKEIWKKGVSLGSLFFYAPWSGKREIAPEGEDHPSSDYFLGMADWDALRELRKKLATGTWVALGYLAPRRRGSRLEVVPKEIFEEADFDSAHSGIVGEGLVFVGVRIVHASLLTGTESAQKPQPGRPSRRNEIVEAYESLRNNGQIDYEAPLTRLVEPIRRIVSARLGVEEKELKGVGPEAIRKTIRPLFDKDRAQ